MASEFLAGTSFVLTVTLTDRQTGEPIPAGNYTIAAQVRKKSNGVLVATLAAQALQQTNKISLSALDTTDWPAGILCWNVRFIDNSNGLVAHTRIGEIYCEIPPTR